MYTLTHYFIYKILCTHRRNKKGLYQILCVRVCMDYKGGNMEHRIYGEISVAQYTKKGELIKIWDSQKEASEATGIAQGNISKCCNGKIKTAGGFCWSFR